MRGSVDGLDFQQALARSGVPSTNLNGRFETSLQFDSLPNALGEAQFSVDRSVVDGVRVYDGQATLRFGAGTMQVDTLRAETSSGTLTAHGGLGLDATRERLAALSSRRRLARWPAPVPGEGARGHRFRDARRQRRDRAARGFAGRIARRERHTLAGNLSKLALRATANGRGCASVR